MLVVVFLLLRLAPGDPARALAGIQASDDAVARIRTELGLDQSIASQFVSYVGQLAHGDLGTSAGTGVPVATVIGDRLPVTAALIGGGILVSIVLSVGLAGIAARARDRPVDHAIRGLTVGLLCMPVFWIALLLILLIAIPTGWFPVGGYGGSALDKVRAITLPALALGCSLAPLQVRALRSSLIEEYGSDHVAAARSLGVGELRLFWRHVLRNAALPVVAVLAVQMGSLLFSVVVVEAAFGLPGIGQALVQAVARRDYATIQGITLVSALIVIAVYLLADVCYALLDPRVEAR